MASLSFYHASAKQVLLERRVLVKRATLARLPLKLSRRGLGNSAVNTHVKAEPPQTTTTASAQDATTSLGLGRLPLWSLARNVFLGAVFSSPILSRSSFGVLQMISRSRSSLLNADANPVLRAVLKALIYDQFCAGTNKTEIMKTKEQIRQMGYSGVALCYGKEVVVSQSKELRSTGASVTKEVESWRDGNFKTLDMAGPDDWLQVKLSGAGSLVATAMVEGKDAPAEFVAAMDALCTKAKAQGCRIWIDAEQQALQKAIDRWTIELMRRHNRDGKALVYTTLQAYLKASRSKLMEQLAQSRREGWTLAFKLVRGAYIGSDERSLIHDTKEDTDASYNGIVRDVLGGTNLGFSEGNFPRGVQMVIAGHNPDSVAAALECIDTLREQGRLRVLPEFAQLQGMGDVLGCSFLERHEATGGRPAKGAQERSAPKIYKSLTWGSVQECTHYLLRRAIENSGGTDRLRDGLQAYVGELKRRVFRSRPRERI